jgi:hypothetical protein
VFADTIQIMPVILHDNAGYWLASRDEITGELKVVGFHFCDDILDHEMNVAPSFVCFLRASGVYCRGYWEGYVGDEVCDCWNDNPALQDENGDPIDGAETIALEHLIAQQTDFLEKNCEFVIWPPADLQ